MVKGGARRFGKKVFCMKEPLVQGVFQVGVLVTDIDECIRLFCDALGMKAVFEARNQIQPAKGLSGVDGQIMDVLMLHGEGGVDLEIHRYVDPAGVPRPPMNHNEIGSMHFMLRVRNMKAVVDKVTALGYEMMTPIVGSERVAGFKYAYFRGPDGMMVELHEGDLPEAGRVTAANRGASEQSPAAPTEPPHTEEDAL